MRDRNKKKKTKIRLIQAAVVALIAVTGILLFKNNALALFNAEKAMRYSEYSSSHTIENSVMFIGTYLININAMTDELYEKAQESQSDSNQMDVYYKSELADGAWFNVTNSETLTDIMDDANKVSEAELANLYVQYYVGADGTVTDVMTDSQVNPFDLPDPYNLSKLKELEPLWLIYTGSAEATAIDEESFLKNRGSDNTGNKRTDVYLYRLLTTFFGLNLRDSDTDKYDADLARLFEAYKTLKAANNDEEADIVYSLMAQVDASRRSIIMDKLAAMEVNTLGVLYDLVNGKYYTVSGNFLSTEDDSELDTEPDYIVELRDSIKHEFEKGDDGSDEWWGPLQEGYEKDLRTLSTNGSPYSRDSSLLDSIMNSKQNCMDSYNKYQSMALTDSNTVLDHAEYEYSVQVIDQTSADGTGGPINLLRDVKNIKEGVIKNSDSEKSLLDSSLLGIAEGNYEEAVTYGESPEYKKATGAGQSQAQANAVLEDDFGKVESKRTELEFLIDAYKQRDAAASALQYVEGCIAWTKELYNGVPADGFQTKANGSIDTHLKWLSDLAAQIRNSDASLKSKLDELNDKKAELQRKRDEALDNNDLAGAKEYDKQIEAVDRDIADEEKKTGKSSSDDLANDILNNALEDLANDPDADVSSAANALAAMGADDAGNKLNDRASSNGNSSAGDGSGSSAGDGSGSSSGDGSGSSSGDGSGSSSGGDGSGSSSGGDGSGSSSSGKGDGSGSKKKAGMSESDILGVLTSFFGKSPEDMNADELAIVTATLSRFGRAGNTEATSMAQKYAEIMRSKNSKYLYNQYSAKSPRYISLKTIGDVSAYRYFYNDTKKQATMTSGSKAFIFTTGTATVERGGKDEQLNYETVFSKDAYISSDDATGLFECYCEYISGSSYAVCLNSAMEGKAKELLEALNNAASGT
ncbi:MAG: hypothetical protein K6G03_11140 [Lachnospiraceae bacterium]|nr:hypothetical protein [Lachnospiraceae bacterium]